MRARLVTAKAVLKCASIPTTIGEWKHIVRHVCHLCLHCFQCKYMSTCNSSECSCKNARLVCNISECPNPDL